MTAPNQRRVATLACLGLLLAGALFAGVAAGSAVQTAGNDTATNETNATVGPTPMANLTRVAPAGFDREYLSISTQEADTRFKTAGPYAVFSTTQPLSAARIGRDAASASVLDGGHTVMVQYEPGAASGGNESYYELQLFFEDGSDRTIELLASQTAAQVVSKETANAAPLLEQIREDAENHGYEPTNQGIEDYYEWSKEQADLFRNLFSDQIKKTISIAILIVTTPFALLLLLVTGILVVLWLLRQHRHKITDNRNDENRRRERHEDLRRAYKEKRQAADEHLLRDVSEIGSQYLFWADAYNVNSVKQLADLATFGAPATDADGNIKRDADGEVVMDHHGVHDLDVDALHGDSWLKAVCKPQMLTPRSALAQIKAALQKMETKYHQPHDYREARKQVESLIDDLDSGEPLSGLDLGGQGSDRGPRFGGAGVGGDD